MTTTMPQHMAALELANQVRTGGAAFRRQVKALSQREGMQRLADELDAGLSRETGTLTLQAFICSVHRMGWHRASRFLHAASLYRRPNVRMRELTQRERDALAAALRSHGG
jgi:hypothetical protein